MMLFEYVDCMFVFVGDVVLKKKLSLDIYNLAAKTFGVDSARCVVVEDIYIGCIVVKVVGMWCCVMKSIYSEDEDFFCVDVVFDCLGDEGDERVKFY